MISLSVMTWRLGNLQSDEFEYLLSKIGKRDQRKLNLADEFDDIFFLISCQRVIFAMSIPKSNIRQFYQDWALANDIDPVKLIEPEWFHGMDALYHLAEVVSALDSAVIGEEQIQGQFRNAYIDSEEYLSTFLSSILQKILRTGKRVRKRSLLEPGQISTISVVAEFIQPEMENADTIGIVGTGKMAKGIIQYFRSNSKKTPTLKVYTTTPKRVNEAVNNIKIDHYHNILPHDIIFTATSQSGLITDEFVKNRGIQDSVIVDLGMPRNCDISNETIKLYTMEEVIKKSRETKQNDILSSAYYVLEDELEQIKIDLMKQQHAETIKNLRMEMLSAAQTDKEKLVKIGTNEGKQFDQLVNKLIHISQQHLEKHILTENKR